MKYERFNPLKSKSSISLPIDVFRSNSEIITRGKVWANGSKRDTIVVHIFIYYEKVYTFVRIDRIQYVRLQ